MPLTNKFARVAQQVERLSEKQEGAGSVPAPGTGVWRRGGIGRRGMHYRRRYLPFRAEGRWLPDVLRNACAGSNPAVSTRPNSGGTLYRVIPSARPKGRQGGVWKPPAGASPLRTPRCAP